MLSFEWDKLSEMALETELNTYEKSLPQLKASEGKFVLIQGERVIDVFGSYEDSLKEGYQKFGVKTPFLVRKIQAVPEIQYVTHIHAPCPT